MRWDRERRRIAARMASATSFESWRAHAVEMDRLHGRECWKDDDDDARWGRRVCHRMRGTEHNA